MNFTESFQEFSSKVGPTDLALYAGAGLVLWILFKDKMSPVQKMVAEVIAKIKNVVGAKKTTTISDSVSLPVVNSTTKNVSSDSEDIFFKLVVSWKQTRDLAVESGCVEAVKVADQMFPYLSPNVCNKDVKENI